MIITAYCVSCVLLVCLSDRCISRSSHQAVFIISKSYFCKSGRNVSLFQTTLFIVRKESVRASLCDHVLSDARPLIYLHSLQYVSRVGSTANRRIIESSGLYSCCMSRRSVVPYKILGARRVIWTGFRIGNTQILGATLHNLVDSNLEHKIGQNYTWPRHS
jgi:hypothetical protein